jgi:iron(III) transport system ATP-binding protein
MTAFSGPAALRFEAVEKRFAGFSLGPISFSLGEGDILSLVGESGSGKTTLLRLAAGFEMPDGGRIWLRERLAAGGGAWMPPEQRRIGVVFQDYALFPHLSVAKNIRFGIHRLPASEQQRRTQELLDLVGLPGCAHKYPHQLSGGEQQRVALARALAPRPGVLLLDEPFSNLDALTKAQLRTEAPRMIREAGIPALFITHDIGDACLFSDRLLVLYQGKLLQEGSPQALRQSPAHPYVAALMGQE